jgi:hypothetical protein
MENDFKSASELGITEVERNALIVVLESMELGKIYSYHNMPAECRVKHADTPKIHMELFFTHDTECGTVGCLAGWANILSDGKAFPELNNAREQKPNSTANIEDMIRRLPLEIRRLFLVRGSSFGDMNDLSHETLIKRLRNYLSTGSVTGSTPETLSQQIDKILPRGSVTP